MEGGVTCLPRRTSFSLVFPWFPFLCFPHMLRYVDRPLMIPFGGLRLPVSPLIVRLVSYG